MYVIISLVAQYLHYGTAGAHHKVDELANIVGAAYPLAQYYVPFLDNFTPKFSYIASKNNVVAENQALLNFLEDHEGQKFWMGITVYNMLPKELQRYWLPTVGLAVGYTVGFEHSESLS
jgi:hypothetical protein